MAQTDAPGTFHYGNTNYALLGLLIEHATGQGWADALKDRIFDPAGMTSTSGDKFEADPKRLSSYDKDGNRLVDVTDATWEARGESGVVSTTSDLIAFERALLIDKTLLSDSAFAEMTDFTRLYSGIYFGLGLFQHTVAGGVLEGFAGGTLGTSTATYANPFDDTVLAFAANLVDVDSDTNVKQLYQILRGLGAWDPIDSGSPLEIRSVSAADIGLASTADGVCFSAKGASVTLDLALRGLAASGTVFADGSMLLVGDCAAGTAGDDLANVISVPRDFASALTCDNRILGLGGDDRLTGGTAGDAIVAGSGNDRLAGNSGDDRLSGGRGDDRIAGGGGADWVWAGRGADVLYGRAGSDVLVGGGGRDTFRFDDGDAQPGAPDLIRDFDPQRDTIDLHLVDAIGGKRGSAFHWIGDGDFSGDQGRASHGRHRQRAAGRGRHKRRRPRRSRHRVPEPRHALGAPLPALTGLSRSSAPGRRPGRRC